MNRNNLLMHRYNRTLFYPVKKCKCNIVHSCLVNYYTLPYIPSIACNGVNVTMELDEFYFVRSVFAWLVSVNIIHGTL